MKAIDILLETWSSNEETNYDCDYFLLHLDEAYAALILNRVNMLQMMQQIDSELDEMWFTDQVDNPWFEWFEGMDDLIELETGKPLSNSPGAGMCCSLEGQLALLQPGVSVPEEAIASTEWRGRMIVDADSVVWMCWPRHTDLRVYTIPLPIAVVREFQERSS